MIFIFVVVLFLVSLYFLDYFDKEIPLQFTKTNSIILENVSEFTINF